jgi:hypothetical protein
MPRAGRILYNLLTTISLLLLLTTVTVWVRSYWVSEEFLWKDRPDAKSQFDFRGINCSQGGIQFYAYDILRSGNPSYHHPQFSHTQERATKYPVYEDWRDWYQPLDEQRFSAIGFEYIPKTFPRRRSSILPAGIVHTVTLPLYFPTLLFALLPVHYLLLVRRHRCRAKRISEGHCPACNYDLRASPDRCPECGLSAAFSAHS